jgi:hypothetical protein
VQRFGIAQNAEPKASKSFRACDAGGARFSDRAPGSIERRDRTTTVALQTSAQIGTPGALAQDDSSGRSKLTFGRRLERARAIELARPAVPATRAITVQIE